jgi:hypothetical protein
LVVRVNELHALELEDFDEGEEGAFFAEIRDPVDD